MIALLIQLRSDLATPEEYGGWRKWDIISARLWEDRRFFDGKLSSKLFTIAEHENIILENRLRNSLILPMDNFIPYPYRGIISDLINFQWRRSNIRIKPTNMSLNKLNQINDINRISPIINRNEYIIEEKSLLYKERRIA